MKNCLIMGSGRSGTSLTAGVLSKAGYFMGDHLNPGNETNPKGQFEDRRVNRINEELLAAVTAPRPPGAIGELLFRHRPVFGQRWLARLPLESSISSPPRLSDEIEALTRRQPFCFKDPRFSYTLPAWRPFIDGAVLICVFRHPAETVESILKQSRRVPHLKNFSIHSRQAFRVWASIYSHILKKHYPQGGDWIFLHYRQFFDGSAYEMLESRLAAEADRNFADIRFNRSRPRHRLPSPILALYRQLCGLAGFDCQQEKWVS